MKINERTLIAYSTTSRTPVDKEGWLWKRGEVNKSFQRRYFILRGNLLFYFEKKTDKEPVGVIILEGSTIELAEEEQEKFAFKIVFHGEGKRTYVIGAETQELIEEWMKLLACSSYNYMKLMVMELQQQLTELEEAERVSGSMSNSSSANGIATSGFAVPDSDQPPQAPPRQRSNPFLSTSKSTKSKPSTSWNSLHTDLGQKILRDREMWCAEKGKCVPVQ